MSQSQSKPVAFLSKQDFQRIKLKSAKRPTAIETVGEVKPLAITVKEPCTRKPLPRCLTDKEREVISRAEAAKQEELLEIRRANQVILTAKCNLIRNAQIAEKNELKREWSLEEARYAELMERERTEALQRAAEEEEERRRQTQEHNTVLRKQLEMKAQERQKQADKITAEAEYLAMLEAKIKASNEQAVKQQEMRREKIKKDLQYAFHMNEKIKASNFEKERLSELKIQEYMRQKKIREEAMEAEKQRQNLAREQKMLTMCQDQLQTRNSQQEKYDKWFQREAERNEKNFRKKELEAAQRKKEFQEKILADREMQMREKQRLIAEEQAREQREYEANLSILKEALEREKLSDCSQQKRREYCELIKEQIKIKEQQRQQERRKAQEALQELQAKERQHKSKINAVLEAKIGELKSSQVPEKLIKDVERRLKRVTSS